SEELELPVSLFFLSQPAIRLPDLVVGFGQIRLKSNRLLELRTRFRVSAVARPETPKLIVRQRVGGIQGNSLFERRQSLGHAVFGKQRHPVEAVGGGIRRPRSASAAQECFRLAALSCPERDHPPQER